MVRVQPGEPLTLHVAAPSGRWGRLRCEADPPSGRLRCESTRGRTSKPGDLRRSRRYAGVGSPSSSAPAPNAASTPNPCASPWHCATGTAAPKGARSRPPCATPTTTPPTAAVDLPQSRTDACSAVTTTAASTTPTTATRSCPPDRSGSTAARDGHRTCLGWLRCEGRPRPEASKPSHHSPPLGTTDGLIANTPCSQTPHQRHPGSRGSAAAGRTPRPPGWLAPDQRSPPTAVPPSSPPRTGPTPDRQSGAGGVDKLNQRSSGHLPSQQRS